LANDLADEAATLEELRSGWRGFWERSTHELTRFVFLRGLGLIYFVAFVSLALQLRGLIGSQGILPAASFLDRLRSFPEAPGFWRLPSLFWLNASDGFLLACAWLGVALSLAVLAGFANAPLMGLVWALYMSFVHVGQIFYGYGWESLLLETGFLAIFLAPPWDPRPIPRSSSPEPVVWLLRWLAFRLMFGAGLIKIRGDDCWTDLTCLAYHYETQPNPSPLSYFFHQAPGWFHQGGVLFNHFVELIAPWGVFGPRRVRHVAGAFLVAFQVILILSGNLSFLNWLTIVVCLSCFDDTLLKRLVPARFAARLAQLEVVAAVQPTKLRRRVILGLVAVVCVLSLNPIVNMLSTRQAMNASFEPFHLVNTYGAFGSVGKTRYEVVIEGTDAATPDESAVFREYEFHCKPGDPARRPCVVSPYHYRLDWQMWFLALGTLQREPWAMSFVYRLLEGEKSVTGLLAKNPFPDRPPRYVRGVYYRYHFARPGDPDGAWWRRELVGEYFRPLSRDDPDLQRFLLRHGFTPAR
jgi:hypothetical protein